MMSEKIIRIVIPIFILFIIGCYLLLNRDNAFSKAFSRDKYDPQKVSALLGFACFGIAVSCVPSLFLNPGSTKPLLRGSGFPIFSSDWTTGIPLKVGTGKFHFPEIVCI